MKPKRPYLVVATNEQLKERSIAYASMDAAVARAQQLAVRRGVDVVLYKRDGTQRTRVMVVSIHGHVELLTQRKVLLEQEIGRLNEEIEAFTHGYLVPLTPPTNGV